MPRKPNFILFVAAVVRRPASGVMEQLTVAAIARPADLAHDLEMDQVTLRRMFGPFFTTKPVGERTGLGRILPIDDDDSVRAALRLTLAHSGHFGIEARNSEEGLAMPPPASSSARLSSVP